MVRRYLIPVLILLSLLGIASAKTPRPLPYVRIVDSRGNAIDLRKYHGQTVVLMIFSTACDTCLKTIEIMNHIQRDLGPKGLQVVAAAGDPNGQYLLDPLTQRYRPLFPLGFIEKDEIIKVAEVPPNVRPVVPIVIFIDRWGMVREQFYGDSPVMQGGEGSLRALARGVMAVTPVGAAR